MGSVWDQCTDPHRHPRFETGQQEAVIAWNAPAAHLPEEDPFLRRALRRVLSEKKSPTPTSTPAATAPPSNYYSCSVVIIVMHTLLALLEPFVLIQ